MKMFMIESMVTRTSMCIVMCWPDVDVLVFHRMDHPPNPPEEAAESVNLGDQGLSTSDPSESIKSESNALAEPMKAVLRISRHSSSIGQTDYS